MPKVAVIIPVWNGATTVAEAIDSVFAQDFHDFEVVIVDDGSTDDTARVLERYANRIKIIQQHNLGPSAARNRACAASGSTYLAFLDSDDRWLPQMLSRLVPILDRDDSCVLAYCNLGLIDGEGNQLNGSLISRKKAHAPTLEEMLDRLWPIMPSAALVRRSAFERAGGFCEELRAFEDVHLWCKLREIGHFHFVPEILGFWRFSNFPPRPKRGGADVTAQGRVFAKLIRERYGADAAKLLAGRVRASRSILSHIGLMALREGDRKSARKAFRAALRADRLRPIAYFRIIRTYLPMWMIPFFTGRTRKPRGNRFA